MRNKIVGLMLVLAVFCGACGIFAALRPGTTAHEYDSQAVQSAASDTTLAQTYRPDIDAVNAPAVVCDVTSAAVLNSLLGSVTPSNAILRFNADCNIVDTDGSVLGSFKDIYNNTLKGKIIPVLYLADEEAANAAIKFLNEELFILDMAVMSDDPAVVKSVRTEHTSIRGIISYGEGTPLYDMVKVTNENYANVAVIPQSMATVENVRYIQGRFKTVWVTAAGDDDVDFYNCIHSGAYGIITTEFEVLYDLYNVYDDSTVFHPPFNVAHRGLPKQCNENSVSGVLAAVKSGATHVEIDGWLTLDGEIMLLHDGLLDRTTHGTGDIETFTTDELKNTPLLMNEEPIPSLTDVIRALKDTDTVIIFEIKSEKPGIIDRLKEVLTEEDCFDRVVAISFHETQIARMKTVLPQIPTAYLYAASTDTLKSDLYQLGKLNTGVDSHLGHISTEYNESLRDRGIVGWYWTYDNKSQINMAVTYGYVGITNNEADSYGAKIKYIDGGHNVTEKLSIGDKIKLKTTSYDGEEKEVDGKVIYCADRGDKWEVIAVYATASTSYYTQSFYAPKREELPASKKGCGSFVAGGMSGVFGIVLIGIAAAVIRRRKTAK